MPRRFRALVGFSRLNRAQIPVHGNTRSMREGTGEFERVEFGIEVADAFNPLTLFVGVRTEKLRISFLDYVDDTISFATAGDLNRVDIHEIDIVQQRFEVMPDPCLIPEHGAISRNVGAPSRDVEELVFAVVMVFP